MSPDIFIAHGNLSISMARQRRRRRRSNKFFAYPVNTFFALGAATDNLIVLSALTTFGSTRVRVVSADLSWQLNGSTAGEGPIRVGLASDNLSATEIGQALDAAPTSQSDIIAIERAKRPVRHVGLFTAETTGSDLRDGVTIRTRLGFSLNEGIELAAWARNKFGATITTGSGVTVTGTLYCVWT